VDELFLGVDIGSSRAKAVLTRRDGAVVAEAVRPQTITRPGPGRAEQDPERDWWDSFVALTRTLLDGRRDGRVAAVGVAALGPCLAVGDAAGRPLRPAILYGIDTRAKREIEELGERYGRETILARCGSPLSTQSVGPKLAWLARNDPTWPAVRTFFTAGSYLVRRLTGEYVLDHHSASQCGPLYDVVENRWIDEWAAHVAPGIALPRLAWAQEALGLLSAEAAAATGLAEGITVAGGTIDSWAEVIASGLRGPGEGLLVYGTTMFLIEVDTPARPDPRLWSTTAFTPGSRNLAAGTGSAGALVSWLSKLSGASRERLMEEAAITDPGAGGLVALPYFAGERTPLFDPDARGLLLGLTVSHTRGHVLRALLEGTAFAVRHNLEAMREACGSIASLRVSGGGARDQVWTQIVSDVTGLPQAILSGIGGGAHGAALLAAVAAGAADLDAPWPRGHTEVLPDTRQAGLYDELYGVYRGLYPATAQAAHTLARLQQRSED
jgi:xylulokinase